MRIKKISPTTPANGNIENQYGTSQTNAYSEAYINSAIPTKTSDLTNDSNFATTDVATTSANGLMSASDKMLLNNANTVTILNGNNVVTNLGVDFWAKQFDYTIIGKVAFCYLIINTKEVPTSTEDATITLPFNMKNDWYLPLIRANKAGTELYLCRGSANTLKLTKTNNRTYVKCNELYNGYCIDCEFFLLLD